MSDNIKIDKKSKIIILRSVVNLKKEDIVATIRIVKDMIAREKYCGVMVDTREIESTPGFGSMYMLIGSFPRNIRCALLIDKEQKTREFMEFIETIAYKRGLFIKVFSSEDSARTWLEKK